MSTGILAAVRSLHPDRCSQVTVSDGAEEPPMCIMFNSYKIVSNHNNTEHSVQVILCLMQANALNLFFHLPSTSINVFLSWSVFVPLLSILSNAKIIFFFMYTKKHYNCKNRVQSIFPILPIM